MVNEAAALAAMLRDLGVTTDPRFEKDVAAFTKLLIERSARVNLTAIKDPHGIMIKHFLDSLTPLRYGLLPQGASVIDVGCGAGFPSTPLALARRDLKITQLDSLGKRIAFLNDAAAALGTGVTVVHARAEDAARTELRDSFDIAVSRALAPLDLLCEYCLPFVKPGGAMLAYKGQTEETADAALKALSGSIEKVYRCELPENAGLRSIVVIRKTGPTDPKYPRSSKNMSKGAIK